MRLHILGPAFGGPSVDPKCVAAVALMQSWERKTGGAWELVCAADHFEQLPLLEVDGKMISGFRDIALYLEGPQKTAQRAEHISIQAFVESHGQTLVDIAYYVSYENYSGRTRPAFAKVLPWYANYALPPRRRALARERTAHLGVSGIDMDDVHESVLDNKPSDSMSMAEKRFAENDETSRRARTLLGRKRTVQSMLRRPEHSGAFKLKNLADNFYEPLAALLEAEKDGMTDQHGTPSAAACLAYGYLSLLANEQLPQSWAADIMSTNYKPLASFVRELERELDLKVREDVPEILFSKSGQSTKALSLPWAAVPTVPLVNKLSFCGHALVQQLPFLPATSPLALTGRLRAADFLPQIMLTTAATIALTGWISYRLGFWPQGRERHVFGLKRLSDYGAAGAALSVLDSL